MTTRGTGRTSDAMSAGRGDRPTTGNRWVINGSDRRQGRPRATTDRAAPSDDKCLSVGAGGESLAHPYRKLHDADRHCRIHVAIIVALLAAGIALVAILLWRCSDEHAGTTSGRPAIAVGRLADHRRVSLPRPNASRDQRVEAPGAFIMHSKLLVEPDTAFTDGMRRG